MRRAMLAVCLLLPVAGCGGGEGGGDAASPASSQAPQSSTKTKISTVTIDEFTFKPGRLTVAAGDEVTWSNVDSANHNVVFDGDAAESIDNLSQQEKGTVTFSQAGTFAYVCSYHPGMEGSVLVQ